MSEGVHIISMSFALRHTKEELEDACRQAADYGIVMLCSAHEDGTNLTYPSGFADTITTTTCDDFGTVAPRSRHQNYEYEIDGLKLAMGIVPFLNSSEYVLGGSVATAIAAGLSSLILSCHQLAQRRDDYLEPRQRAHIVKHHLQQMAVNEKFVRLGRLVGIDVYINDGRDIDIETTCILRQVLLKDLN